jgi:hypothetical protein
MNKWQITRDTIPRFSDLMKFWGRVNKSGSCWTWKGRRLPSGYGSYCYQNWTVPAHRFSYFAVKLGYYPAPKSISGMDVCHSCDNRSCVRPSHLSLKPHAANQLEMKAKGRSTHGSRNGQSKLTEDVVREIREYFKYNPFKRGDYLYVAQLFGVNKTAIRMIVLRERWAHI